MSFKARYDGRCPVCEERIYQDDTVVYDDDDNVIHEECDEDDQADLNPRWKVIVED